MNSSSRRTWRDQRRRHHCLSVVHGCQPSLIELFQSPLLCRAISCPHHLCQSPVAARRRTSSAVHSLDFRSSATLTNHVTCLHTYHNSSNLLTIWRPLLPYGYSNKASCACYIDRVKPPFVIFDIRALWRSARSGTYRMLYNCIHMAIVGVKRLNSEMWKSDTWWLSGVRRSPAETVPSGIDFFAGTRPLGLQVSVTHILGQYGWRGRRVAIKLVPECLIK